VRFPNFQFQNCISVGWMKGSQNIQLLPLSGRLHASVYFNDPNIRLVFSDILSSDLLVQQLPASEHKLRTFYNRDLKPRAEFCCALLYAMWVTACLHVGHRNSQNHCVSGLCASSGIRGNYKSQRFGNWVCFRHQVKGRRHLLCWVP
jgi:hypothetical protein